MSVRARFFVQNVSQSAAGVGTVLLQAVSRGEENKKWASFTPNGQLTMSLSRQAGPALDFFLANLGKECFIDITLADDQP